MKDIRLQIIASFLAMTSSSVLAVEEESSLPDQAAEQDSSLLEQEVDQILVLFSLEDESQFPGNFVVQADTSFYFTQPATSLGSKHRKIENYGLSFLANYIYEKNFKLFFLGGVGYDLVNNSNGARYKLGELPRKVKEPAPSENEVYYTYAISKDFKVSNLSNKPALNLQVRYVPAASELYFGIKLNFSAEINKAAISLTTPTPKPANKTADQDLFTTGWEDLQREVCATLAAENCQLLSTNVAISSSYNSFGLEAILFAASKDFRLELMKNTILEITFSPLLKKEIVLSLGYQQSKSFDLATKYLHDSTLNTERKIPGGAGDFNLHLRSNLELGGKFVFLYQPQPAKLRIGMEVPFGLSSDGFLYETVKLTFEGHKAAHLKYLKEFSKAIDKLSGSDKDQVIHEFNVLSELVSSPVLLKYSLYLGLGCVFEYSSNLKFTANYRLKYNDAFSVREYFAKRFLNNGQSYLGQLQYLEHSFNLHFVYSH